MTESQVIEIRQLVKNKVPQKKVATQFNITDKAVHDIARGRTYKTYGGPIIKPYEGARKLTYEMEVDVLHLNYYGESGGDIANYICEKYEIEVADTTINKFIREFGDGNNNEIRQS